MCIYINFILNTENYLLLFIWKQDTFSSKLFYLYILIDISLSFTFICSREKKKNINNFAIYSTPSENRLYDLKSSLNLKFL